MSKSRQQILKNRKRRIGRRLEKRNWAAQEEPMFEASNIHYEVSERTRGLKSGGIGAIQKLVQVSGLVEAIDEKVKVLKVHLPYQESDHVLNVAYNILAGGTCLEDLELLRNDEVYLDALGAQRIPDPTTAGDFCRRFRAKDIDGLMEAINESRLRVWSEQPAAFFEEAKLDVDGTLVETLGECKEGMHISYKGVWGFHPLVVSLANTQEPLYVVNRSGNRPSNEGASERLDQAIELCRRAGFKKVTLRGDTDFTQTKHLDRWDEQGVKFVFGIDAMPNLKEIADRLPERAWKRLPRRAKYQVKTEKRQRPDNVKEAIVRERGYKNIRLESEQVAECSYSPTACEKTYRLVVVRKNLSVERGEQRLFDEIVYFFYLTNKRSVSAREIVWESNDRCNQENLVAQLKGGVHALKTPLNNLESNWAYMVMASLAWSLKAWFGLLLAEKGRWAAQYRAAKRALLRKEPLTESEVDDYHQVIADACAWSLTPVWNHRAGPSPGEAATVERPVGRELGVRYHVTPRHRGEDPLLFLDLRAGRRLILEHARDESVLNLFAYTGGVSLCAARAGAREVWNVDFARSANE